MKFSAMLSIVVGIGFVYSGLAEASCSSSELIDATVAHVSQVAQGTHGIASEFKTGVFSSSSAGLQVVAKFKLQESTSEPIERIALAQIDGSTCQITMLSIVPAEAAN